MTELPYKDALQRRIIALARDPRGGFLPLVTVSDLHSALPKELKQQATHQEILQVFRGLGWRAAFRRKSWCSDKPVTFYRTSPLQSSTLEG